MTGPCAKGDDLRIFLVLQRFSPLWDLNAHPSPASCETTKAWVRPINRTERPWKRSRPGFRDADRAGRGAGISKAWRQGLGYRNSPKRGEREALVHESYSAQGCTR